MVTPLWSSFMAWFLGQPLAIPHCVLCPFCPGSSSEANTPVSWSCQRFGTGSFSSSLNPHVLGNLANSWPPLSILLLSNTTASSLISLPILATINYIYNWVSYQYPWVTLQKWNSSSPFWESCPTFSGFVNSTIVPSPAIPHPLLTHSLPTPLTLTLQFRLWSLSPSLPPLSLPLHSLLLHFFSLIKCQDRTISSAPFLQLPPTSPLKLLLS